MLGFGITTRLSQLDNALRTSSSPAERAGACNQLIHLGRRSAWRLAVGGKWGRRGEPRLDPWVLLARRLHVLTNPDQLRVLAAGAELWAEVFRVLSTSQHIDDRTAAARIAGACDDQDVIVGLGHLVADANPSVSAAAAEALLAQLARCTSGAGASAPVWQGVQAGLGESINAFDAHRRTEVLARVLKVIATPALRAGLSAAMLRWLDEPDHVAHMPARGLIRRSERGGPVDRLAAWGLLGSPALTPACAERLWSVEPRAAGPEGVAHAERYAEMLRAGHLAEHPDRRRAWARSAQQRERAAHTILDDERFIEPDDTRAASRVARVLAAAGTQRCWNTAIGLLADRRRVVRWSLVREVIALDGPADVLLDAAMDSDPLVACAAVRACYTPWGRARLGREALSRLSGALVRSEHEPVRTLARALLASHEPWHVDDAGSRTLARRMLKHDRAGFVQALRRRVLEGDADRRIGALRVAERFGLGPEIETDLRAIVRSSAMPAAIGREDHQRVAATAVRVLGSAAGPSAIACVIEASRHPDPRVRSNAADALARAARLGRLPPVSHDQTRRTIVELKLDPHHRVRASAIRAEIVALAADGRALGTPDGLQNSTALIRPMLGDDRPLHRVAGLWLAERIVSEWRGVPWEGIAGTVAAMVSGDPSPEVRVRARRCATSLLARTRPGWGRDDGAATR